MMVWVLVVQFPMKKPLPCLVGSGGRTTAHDAGENPKRTKQTFRATMLSERQPGKSESL